MKTISEYQWQGHSIKVLSTAHLRYLWLDYRRDILVDNQLTEHQNQRSFTESRSSFYLKHNCQKLKAHIISSGWPCNPFVTQSAIIDDTIIEKTSELVPCRLPLLMLIAAGALSLMLL